MMGGRAAEGLRACPRRSFQESESSAGGEGKRRSLREKNGREARRDLAVRPKGALRPPSPSFPGGLCVGTACPPCQAGKHHGYAYQQEEEGAASRGARRLPDGLGMPACGPDAPGDPAWEAHAGSACHWAALQGAGRRGLALCAAGWHAGSALAIPCSTGLPTWGRSAAGRASGGGRAQWSGAPFNAETTQSLRCAARAALQFVADGVFYAELNELLTRELAADGYSGVEVRSAVQRGAAQHSIVQQRAAAGCGRSSRWTLGARAGGGGVKCGWAAVWPVREGSLIAAGGSRSAGHRAAGSWLFGGQP